MKKRIALVLAALSFTGIFTACGTTAEPVTENEDGQIETNEGTIYPITETEVKLKNGEVVTCLIYAEGRYGASMSCDWTNKVTPDF